MLQVKSNRDVGLMVIDTSRPGWTVLHADCNNAAIDSKQGEGQSLWDLFKVPDVVRHPPEAFQPCSMQQHSTLFLNQMLLRYVQKLCCDILDNQAAVWYDFVLGCMAVVCMK